MCPAYKVLTKGLMYVVYVVGWAYRFKGMVVSFPRLTSLMF